MANPYIVTARVASEHIEKPMLPHDDNDDKKKNKTLAVADDDGKDKLKDDFLLPLAPVNLKISSITYNVNGCLPEKNTFLCFAEKQSFKTSDVIQVCLQEIVAMDSKLEVIKSSLYPKIVEDRVAKWKNHLEGIFKKTKKRKFEVIYDDWFGGVAMIILCNTIKLEARTVVNQSYKISLENDMLKHRFLTKTAVGTKFLFHCRDDPKEYPKEFKVGFVSCHLPAHTGLTAWNNRKQALQKIQQQMPAIFLFHHETVFLAGDLNFRRLLTHRSWWLDGLNVALDLHVLPGFEEVGTDNPKNRPVTYKVDVKDPERKIPVDTQRGAPCGTDAILLRTPYYTGDCHYQKVSAFDFESEVNSDHKPLALTVYFAHDREDHSVDITEPCKVQ